MSSVLIVDDEPAVREFLGRWLAAAGHQIREASDAETGLALASETLFDVVLCDMHMPGRGGRWLVDRLLVECPTTAIVLATADDQVPPSLSFKHGVVDYLVKPFDRQRVLDAVARAAETRGSAVARRASDEALNEWLERGSK